MSSNRPRAVTRGGWAAVTLLTAFLATAAVSPPRAPTPERVTTPSAAGATPTVPVPLDRAEASEPATSEPAALVEAELALRAGPVAVPLELHVPSIGVVAAVLGVGITDEDVMDAPMGAAEDPVWGQAFWYRGSAVPGSVSTALLAGHVGGPGGLPGVFAHLGELRPGDPVITRDTRNGIDVHFSVTRIETYTLEEAARPEALREIYGVGPVAGTEPQVAADGLAHLTLITCAGTFRGDTHDRRLVVYATRTA